MKTLAIVIGTRPEAIKVAPLVIALRSKSQNNVNVVLIASGQQMDLTRRALENFELNPDIEASGFQDQTSCPSLRFINLYTNIHASLASLKPWGILVQGDTTTALIAAVIGFQLRCRVFHLEAGLRSFDKYNPFPEETNRKLITQLADIHFAPSPASRINLLLDGVGNKNIFVTGNTGLDALRITLEKLSSKNTIDNASTEAITLIERLANRRFAVVTLHRRESLEKDLDVILAALRRCAMDNEDFIFLFPLHTNPSIRQKVLNSLLDVDRVILSQPLDYEIFISVLNYAQFVITDSGGVQEECTYLGKKTLVLRRATERNEGVKAGILEMVPLDYQIMRERINGTIKNNIERFKDNDRFVFGDGKSAERISNLIAQFVQNESLDL